MAKHGARHQSAGSISYHPRCRYATSPIVIAFALHRRCARKPRDGRLLEATIAYVLCELVGSRSGTGEAAAIHDQIFGSDRLAFQEGLQNL